METVDRIVTPNVAASEGDAASARRTAAGTVSVAKAARTAPAFILDNPLRDLHGLTFAAAEVALRAGAALLVPMYRQVHLFDWAMPRALVVNYVRAANLELRRWAHDREVPVVVLETEGAPSVDPDMVATGIAADPEFGRVASFLFWSEAMRDAVRRAWPDESKPVFHVTGHPRFDLLADPLRSVLARTRDPERPVVLFATSFPLVNNFANNTPASELVVYWRAVGGVDWEYLDRMAEIAQRFAFAIRAARAVAESYPKGTVVVRPHPFEGHAIYREALGDLPNVEINARGSSIEAIAAADVLFHVRSNTAFEARVLGVPAASLIPDGAPQRYAVDRTSVEVRTLDDVLDFVAAALRGEDTKPEIPAELLSFALGANRGSASARVADTVVEAAAETTEPPSLVRLPKRSWVRPWLAVRKGHWVADDREKKKVFAAADVQPWLDRYSAAHDKPRLVARDVVGRPYLDPPVPRGGAPLAVEISLANG